MSASPVHPDIEALQTASQRACEVLRHGYEVTGDDILVVHEVVSRLQAALEFWRLGHSGGEGLHPPDL